MFSVSVTSLIYSSGNHRMWTSPLPPGLETVPIRAMRVCWKLRLHIETLFHLYSILWHSNSNKDFYLPLLSWQQKAKVEKKNAEGLSLRSPPSPPNTNQRWFMVWTKSPQQNSFQTAQVLRFCYLLGGGKRGGWRATRFPYCNAVESSFSLPTLKAWIMFIKC